MKNPIKNIIKILSLICLILITNVAIVSAATGLNVILANQNPDPVEPGNFVYVNVKVSNSGSSAINDAKLTLMENDNFKVAQGEDKEKELGIIPPYSSSENSNSFTISKYKIHVNEKTPTGLNTVTFKFTSDIGTYSYDFDIMVQDNNPLVEVVNLDIPEIEPGKSSNINIELKNINTIDLKSIKIALDLDEIENNIITMNSGSNERVIELIKAQDSAKATFDIAISPDAESIPYLLPIKISYQDILGNAFENIIFGTVKVYSPPYLSVNIDSQDIYTIGKGKINLAIANPGSSKIKGVQIEIQESEDYTIIEGEKQYIGDLNSDDFQTLLTQIYINNDEKATLKVKLIYFDSYDVKNEEELLLPLKIYNNDQLIDFGFATNGNGFFSISMFVYLIVGIILGYVISNIRNKKKKNHR